jgi:hypothetical protein
LGCHGTRAATMTAAPMTVFMIGPRAYKKRAE